MGKSFSLDQVSTRRYAPACSMACPRGQTNLRLTSRSPTSGRIKRVDISESRNIADIACRFWYIKLQAFTAMRDFEGLDAFAKSKRSPIGYEPFVRHLMEKGHLKEAATYVPRCDVHKRVDLYVECGEWKSAGKECKERGDRVKLT
jgi:vacuolar protein sorting-associated protein 16